MPKQSESGPRIEARVPPHNLDAEESVLGAMMLSEKAISAVVEILRPDDFYRPSHSLIYKAALQLYAKGEPVDAITVVDRLAENGDLDAAGGHDRIHELSALVPAAANAAHYARIVREMGTLRGLTEVGAEIADLGWERPGETSDLLDRAERILFELSQARVTTEFAHIETLLKESFERITVLYEAGEEVTGVPAGFRDIDRLTSGFQPGNLIIVAARPSMGKSGFALCAAANIAVRRELPVALFTLEMSKSEVTQRLMCSEAKVESQRLRTGKLAADDWPRLTAACDKLAKAPIYVDDTGSITMMEIRSKARRLKTKEPNLALVIVDYLQLMTSGSTVENRVQEVSQISRNLKVLARDLDVPVLALSQLSRAVEQRHDKRPILSDLRESGCLPGDTRVYLPDEGVYRPIRELVGTAGFRVLAVDDRTLTVEPRRVTRAFATGRKPVYRLTTRLGRTIRATGNHKFLAVDGWRRLDDMGPGMEIAFPSKLPGRETRTMADDELALLGHLVGAGSVAGEAVQYTTRDRAHAELVAALALDVFGTSVRPRVVCEGDSYRTYLATTKTRSNRERNPIAGWLAQLGMTELDGPERRIPDAVFAQAAAAIGVFLRHLWATGAVVRPANDGLACAISFGASSLTLTRDLQSLLLRLGISSRRRSLSAATNGTPAHRLDVAARDDLERFSWLAGGLEENGARAVDPVEADVAEWASVAAGNAYRAPVPVVTWSSTSTLVRTPAAPVIRNGQLERQSAATSTRPIVEDVSHGVDWDEIVSIERDGEEDVYDLTVEGLHSFVAEDLIVHNSLEQDADLVFFIYRDEYYNDESDQQGIAELHLAKHRNGPTGTEKLAFMSRYAKFADLAAG